MRIFLFAVIIVLSTIFSEKGFAQGFPNPDSMATGQASIGSLDPVWLVSDWYSTAPASPLGLSYISAEVTSSSVSGWVNPTSLPAPQNTANWISNPNYSETTNTNGGYIYFRLTITLPPACNGVSIATAGNYTLSFSGYVDNSITDVYVNGVSTGFSGGGYSSGSGLNFTLTGPWVAGTNYIDVQTYNTPNSGVNPYGLLLVANATPNYANGCPPAIVGDTVICSGDSTTLWVNESGYNYAWSTGSSSDSIRVGPTTNTTYTVTVSNSGGYTATSTVNVKVNSLPPAAINPATASICPSDSTTLTASGGTGYLWNNSANTTTITVSPASATTYTVTVTNANNCSATASRTVTINSVPTPTINPLTAQICTGDSTTLTAGGGTSYLWNNAATTPSITVSPALATTYSVTVTNATSCTATTSRTVNVNSLPTPSVNPPTVSICTGDSTTLTASGGTSYLWSNAAATAAITVSPGSTTTYLVTVTNANNCSATTSGTVNVNGPPIPIINPPTGQICSGDSITLTAGGGSTYLWSNGATTPAITVSPASATPYSVTVSNGNNCSATTSRTVNVNSLPTPTMNPPAVSICSGDNTTLTAGGGTSYLWSNTATSAAITVSPTSPTTYFVTVTDANNCSATTSGTVNVNALPIPTVTPPTATICAGDSATLTAGGGTSYLWSNTATTTAITVSPASPTTYDVTVTDANNCSATTSGTVNVNALPVPTMNPPSVSICSGDNTTLTAGGGTSYLWSNAATTPAITVSPTSPTTYFVTITNANNCSATTSSTVSVNALPTPAITQPTTQICNGDNATLTASGGNGYLWSNAATTAAVSVSPTTNTTYSVTVTNANNCTASTSETVTVIPTMNLSTVITNVTCNGNNDGSIDLTVSSGQPTYNYLWSNAATTQNINSLTSGNYTVTVTDNAGCTATTSGSVSEPPLLTMTSTYNNPTCASNNNDGSITLSTAGGTLPYQFIWSNSSSSPSLSDLGPGNYAVTVSDANNCTVGASFTLAYIYDFTVQATPAVTILLGDSAVLGYAIVGNAGNVSSIWSPAQSLSCSTCTIPVARPDYTTLYQVEVTNDSGCKASDTVTVIVTPNYSIYVPNAFSPNGDGINDVFQIYGRNPNVFAYMDIQIFDRWGEMVFQSNDLYFSWDGTYRGTHLASGTYIWQLLVTFIDGHSSGVQKGSLTLIR